MGDAAGDGPIDEGEFMDFEDEFHMDEFEHEEVEEEEEQQHIEHVDTGPKVRASDLAIANDDYVNFPYGQEYEKITQKTIRQIETELGIVRLCWPDIKDPQFEGRSDFPNSYYKNTNKEKVALLFAESFRRQFSGIYPHRKLLYLASENECGVQKLVSTTIKITALPYPEVRTALGCGKFVADYINYQPLEKPNLPPDHIYGPYTILKRQKGHSFEMATLLCGLLIATGYDAYVCSGYATREVCMNWQDRVTSPVKPKVDEVEEETATDTSHMKYALKGRKDLRSKFLLEQEQKAKDKLAAKLKLEEEAIQRAIEISELPPADPLSGLRVHSWVVVLGLVNRHIEEIDYEAKRRLEEEAGEEEEEWAELAKAGATDGLAIGLQRVSLAVAGARASVAAVRASIAQQRRKSSIRAGAIERKSVVMNYEDDDDLDELIDEDKESVVEEEPVQEEEESVVEEEAAVEEVVEEKKEEKKKEDVVVENFPFFMEPTTGVKYDTDCPLYLGLEAVWNHLNYWVNLQDCSDGIGCIDFSLNDNTFWEHFLTGEPIHFRILPASDGDDAIDLTMQEKHLDMPMSWVEKLEVTVDSYEKRYPIGCKSIDYKKAVVENYSPYHRHDGIVQRLTHYLEMEYTTPIMQYDWYMYREDFLTYVTIDFETNWKTEKFLRGRPDALKVLQLKMTVGDSLRDQELILGFYHKARCDGLCKVEYDPLCFKEHLKNRDDRLYLRDVSFAPKGKPPPGMQEGPRKLIISITEKFDRNHDIPATEDIAVRSFEIIKGEIKLIYHNEENCATASTRHFKKPNVADTGEKLLWNPELTTGYQANPTAKPPKHLDLFILLKKQLSAEEISLEHVRDMEDEIANIISLRAMENSMPSLYIDPFNKQRNQDIMAQFIEVQKGHMAETARQVASQIDLLGPTLAKQGLLQKEQDITPEIIPILKRECLRDFKKLMVTRAQQMQVKYEGIAEQVLAMRSWYAANIDKITKDEESTYFKECGTLAFTLHVYEIRLKRHAKLSQSRYRDLASWLDTDERLSFQPDISETGSQHTRISRISKMSRISKISTKMK